MHVPVVIFYIGTYNFFFRRVVWALIAVAYIKQNEGR